ncbi:hypothetical protein E8E01_18965 [Methylorubrum populi]|uniref:hypothetical protein n=1 Tax=Methylorubrum populi TaxID=223967 RepID=UPI00114D8F10|nr:hypothetical protein [Methylorubrum populi]QDI82355.1 hypothetical protein E8E01_18965 [Methylorubrum populi]
MTVEITFGGTCRDIDLLPRDENELKTFFETELAPAIFQDLRKNFLMAKGQGADTTRDFPGALQERGCDIGGSVVIKF